MDDMSKKMDMIIKILEHIMGETPSQQGAARIPDALRGVFGNTNHNFKGQNSSSATGNMIAKLYESQQIQQAIGWSNASSNNLQAN